MALTEFTKDMAIIQKLEDEPNDVGGLTAAQLKGKFDEGGTALKEYINGTLLPQLAADTAAEALGAKLDGTPMTVQGALDELRQATVKSGNVPVGGNAGDFLRKKSGELYDMEWADSAVLSAAVEFAAADWTQGGDGMYTLRVPAASHRRSGPVFGCALRHLVDSVLLDGTWAVLGTRSGYDRQTGDIVLTSSDAYDGAAVFHG